MNHTTQEPKSMQLAVELEYRREYEAAHELRTMQARIADLEAQLHAIGAISVKQSIRPQAQPDTAAQQAPVAGARCKIIDNCKSCQHSAGRQSCMLANRAFEGRERPPTPPDWCPLPLYAAPQQPVQQEPVAWMYEWNGRTHITTADQRPIEHAHPHFNKSKPLYTAPQPAENPNCKSNQKRLATLWGYVKQDLAHHPLTDEQIVAIANKARAAEAGDAGYILPISFARAIEEAHSITGGQ